MYRLVWLLSPLSSFESIACVGGFAFYIIVLLFTKYLRTIIVINQKKKREAERVPRRAQHCRTWFDVATTKVFSCTYLTLVSLDEISLSLLGC